MSDLNNASVEVDVLPAQGEELTLSHTKSQRDRVESLEPVTCHGLEQSESLFG